MSEKNAILEYVAVAGEDSDAPPSRACVPGHALEAFGEFRLVLDMIVLAARRL